MRVAAGIVDMDVYRLRVFEHGAWDPVAQPP